MMITGYPPIDFITEILLRLPAKSIARFRSVSKQWASILGHSLFLTKSSSHPRLIFAIEEKGLWSIFTLPQHHPSPHDDKASSSSPSSPVVTPEFHTKFPPENMGSFYREHRKFACSYASGLIYFYGLRTNVNEEVPVTCNPKTGRYETLPHRKTYSFLGFDPVGKQYKVLHVAYPCGPDDHRIMTLGTRGTRWRKIRCSLKLKPLSEGLCINGALYYLGDTSVCDEKMLSKFVIACFDVRSEKFSFLYPESFCELIKYNGKLGVVYYDDLSDDAVEFRVWVLEDAEKREWSKYAYTLSGYKLFPRCVSVVGVISTSEIVLSMSDYTSQQPFYVFYFNPEKNTIRRFEIQGFGDNHQASNDPPRRVYVFVDDCNRFLTAHVEDLNVNDPKLLKSSVYIPSEYNEESEDEEDTYDDHDQRHFFGKKKRV